MDRAASAGFEIKKHNAVFLLKGVLSVLASLLCWYISYLIIKWLFLVILFNFGVESPGTIATWIGLGGCLLLVIEGIRVGKPAMEMADIRRWRSTDTYGGMQISRTMGYAYVVSQILFCAPRLTVYGIQALKSRISLTDRERQQAEQLMTFLAETNTWHDISELAYDQSIFDILHAVDLVRVREAGPKTEINLSPKARDLYGVHSR
jgi:hypothetical protein